MKLMKVFDAPYEPKEVRKAWYHYNDLSMRGYISICVDDDLLSENGYYAPLYNWLIANGAEHGETVLVEYNR